MLRRLTGTTLLEMLTVMAVLTAVAAVAVPGYRRHLLHAQRLDATTFLLQVYAAQQRFHLQHGRYVVLTDQMPRPQTDGGLGLSTTSEFGNYRVTLTATGTGYRATARRSDASAEDSDCIWFAIEESGMRQAVDAAGADHTDECFA